MNIPKKIPPCKSCLVQSTCNQPCHDLYTHHHKRLRKLKRLNSLVPVIVAILSPVIFLVSYIFNLIDRNIVFVTVIGTLTLGFIGILIQAKFFAPRIRVSDHVTLIWEVEYVYH